MSIAFFYICPMWDTTFLLQNLLEFILLLFSLLQLFFLQPYSLHLNDFVYAVYAFVNMLVNPNLIFVFVIRTCVNKIEYLSSNTYWSLIFPCHSRCCCCCCCRYFLVHMHLLVYFKDNMIYIYSTYNNLLNNPYAHFFLQ